MNPLIEWLLLEFLLASLGEVPPPESRPAASGPVPSGYTLSASCSSFCAGRLVQFTGSGYYPPGGLATYQICVSGEREFSRAVDEDHDVIEVGRWTECRAAGFVGSDGVLRFSQPVSPATTSVCTSLFRSYSATTRRIPASESGLGVPLTVWPERTQTLACVYFH
jgi:hypothetical protein